MIKRSSKLVKKNAHIQVIMILIDAIKYLDALGSRRYFVIAAMSSNRGFVLNLFDPGPVGIEEAVMKQVDKFERYIENVLRSKIKSVNIFLSHTHPTTAGSVGRLYELISRRYEVTVYAHVRSLPLIEKSKTPEELMRNRFERDTNKKLRLFKELSPPIYRPYYVHILRNYSLPELEALIPQKRSPNEFVWTKLDLDIDDEIYRMRSAGHSYEHVVYKIVSEDFTGLILGDEGPVIMGAFPIWYNDATSWPYSINNLEKRHEVITEGLESARFFRSHGARKFSKAEWMSMVAKYLNNLWEAVVSEFETLEEVIRMRVSDAAAAMLIRDYFSKYPETIKRSKIAKTHYINAENLPIFTARGALVYLNGRGTHKKIYTRNIDPSGRYRYIEVKVP